MEANNEWKTNVDVDVDVDVDWREGMKGGRERSK